MKSSFYDPLPSTLMMANKDILVPYLTKLVNMSLYSGCFDGLKESIVLPLLKKSQLDVNDMANYRPVSNLPFLSKLIERVVMRKLNEHIYLNNLSHEEQFGYKKYHSTETLLLNLTDNIHSSIDKGFGVVVVSIDFSAAFDTVNHDLLLSILENVLNIKDMALSWFKSYFHCRSQRVKIGDSLSSSSFLDFGVPQGSILGPVLYNIYSHSIISVFKQNNFDPLGFADDNEGSLKFAYSFQNEVLLNTVPHLLFSLQTWSYCYGLKINPPKNQCHSIWFFQFSYTY